MLALSVVAAGVGLAAAVGLAAHIGRGLFHASYKSRRGVWA